MPDVLDLSPAARRMHRVLAGIDAAHLSMPTPCDDSTVAVLVDHVLGLTEAFTAAARKDFGPMTDTPPGAVSDLPHDWRSTATNRLAVLADAWREPDAWTGTTRAGGIELPGHVAGLVALDELVVHGWDLAVATGQSYTCEASEIAACTAFAESITEEQRTAGGLFGPVGPVPQDASPLERLIGLTGRDPRWSPGEAP